jgi:hypothetical protein
MRWGGGGVKEGGRRKGKKEEGRKNERSIDGGGGGAVEEVAVAEWGNEFVEGRFGEGGVGMLNQTRGRVVAWFHLFNNNLNLFYFFGILKTFFLFFFS